MAGRLRYVISSSWRHHFDRQQLERVFRANGLSCVADNFHAGQAWRCRDSAGDRQGDIEHWLAQYHDGDEPFAILDDPYSGGGLNFHRAFVDHVLFGRVVLCQAGVGLTDGHVDQVVSALSRPCRTCGDE